MQMPWEIAAEKKRQAGASSLRQIVPPDPEAQRQRKLQNQNTGGIIQERTATLPYAAPTAGANLQGQRLTNEGIALTNAGKKTDLEILRSQNKPVSPQTAQRKLAGVIRALADIAKDANDNKGWGETGFTGAIQRHIPGSPSYSLKGKIDGVSGKLAVDAIAALKQQGVSLGPPLSDKDVTLARNSVANLDPNMDQVTFMEQLQQAQQTYLDLYKRAGGKMRDPKKAKRDYNARAGKSAVIDFNDLPE